MAGRLRKYGTVWEQRDAVDRWRASGLSQAAFCRQEGIPEWALSDWKRRQLRSEQLVKGKACSPQYGAPPKERRKQESYWRVVIDGQERSGLSVIQFCRRNVLSVATFRRWRRKLAIDRMPHSTVLANPFVAVKLVSEPPDEPTDSVIDIALPGGSTVRITERTPLHLLCKVLRALEEKC